MSKRSAPILPNPDSDNAGRNLVEIPGSNSLAQKALKWRPKGADEAIAATAARVAVKLAKADGSTATAEDLAPTAATVAAAIAPTTGTIRYLRVNADDSFSELSLTQLLSDLTPNRLLHIEDFAASYFNTAADKTSIGTIPLTAAEAVIGTKIRLRGFVKMGFQGTYPAFGGDCLVALAFNVAADSAMHSEGVLFVVNAGSTAMFHVDAELEIVDATGGEYKLGVSASQTCHAMAVYEAAGSINSRWWDDAGGSLFVVDPTTAETIGSTAGLVVQFQTSHGTTPVDQSLCNFWMDLNYEITPP